jgi:hypothetical protein
LEDVSLPTRRCGQRTHKRNTSTSTNATRHQSIRETKTSKAGIVARAQTMSGIANRKQILLTSCEAHVQHYSTHCELIDAERSLCVLPWSSSRSRSWSMRRFSLRRARAKAAAPALAAAMPPLPGAGGLQRSPHTNTERKGKGHPHMHTTHSWHMDTRKQHWVLRPQISTRTIDTQDS